MEQYATNRHRLVVSNQATIVFCSCWNRTSRRIQTSKSTHPVANYTIVTSISRLNTETKVAGLPLFNNGGRTDDPE